jgi:hypothetical protein
MMTVAPAQVPQYRVLGTTDEFTTCDLRGRTNLKSTIALAMLDADGNETDVVYYGSDCGPGPSASHRVVARPRPPRSTTGPAWTRSCARSAATATPAGATPTAGSVQKASLSVPIRYMSLTYLAVGQIVRS